MMEQRGSGLENKRAPILKHSKDYSDYNPPYNFLTFSLPSQPPKSLIAHLEPPVGESILGIFARHQKIAEKIRLANEKPAEEEKIYPQQDASQKTYAKLDDFFREDLDHQFGIIRNVIKDEKKYPTGIAVIRDATAAKEINDRTINHLQVEANNTLLRGLGRLRSIDYVLMVKSIETADETERKIYNDLREQLKKEFDTFITAVYGVEYQTEQKQLETTFNTTILCHILHEANLDEGCVTTEDYKQLLFHYRNLSSFIDPAKSLVTVSYDADNHILHRITQDPVTTKLPEQTESILREMGTVTAFPTNEEKNFQTAQNKSIQIANRYFATSAASDDRTGPAQTRKTLLDGSRNTFFTTSELVFFTANSELTRDTFLDAKARPADTRRFVRGATPVYVGKGESEARITQAARHNIEQVRQFVITQLKKEGILSEEEEKNFGIHFTCLLTDTKWFDSENQKLMIRISKAVTEDDPESKNGFTAAACNFEGAFYSMKVSAKLPTEDAENKLEIDTKGQNLNQAERYRQVAKLSCFIAGKKHIIELVGCASGQDGTGTEAEYTDQEFKRECYTRHSIDDTDAVEKTSAKSRNTAEMATHLSGGSLGCKKSSKGEGLFSADTDKAIYLDSAETNKEPELDKNQLETMVKNPSEMALKKYEKMKNEFDTTCERGFHLLELYARPVPTYLSEHIPHPENTKPEDLYLLTEALETANRVVKGPGADPIRYSRDVYRLITIAETLDKSHRYAGMVGELLMIAGAGLLLVGVLAVLTAPATGGSSLLALALSAETAATFTGITGLTATTGVGLATLGSTAFVAGAIGYTVERKYEKNPLTQVSHKLSKLTELAPTTSDQNDFQMPFTPSNPKDPLVPFTPAFFLSHCDSLINQKKVEKNDRISLISSLKQGIVYTQAAIQTALTRQSAMIDINRLAWSTPERKPFNLPTPAANEEHSAASIDITLYTKKMMEEFDVSSEEAEALLTVSSAIGAQEAQGGALKSGQLLFGTTFSSGIFAVNKQGSPSTLVVYRVDGILVIENVYKPSSVTLLSGMKEINNPFEYRERYILRQNQNNWELTLSPNSSLSMNPEFLKHIVEQAIKKLKQTQLSDDDLFLFVPCLTDKAFAKEFLKKLKENFMSMSPDQDQKSSMSPNKNQKFPISPNQSQQLKDLISKNYGEKWPVHLSSIRLLLEKKIMERAPNNKENPHPH